SALIEGMRLVRQGELRVNVKRRRAGISGEPGFPSAAERLEQLAELALDVRWIRDRLGDLQAHELAIALAQAMQRDAHGDLRERELARDLGPSDVARLAREERLQAREQRRAARARPLGREGGRGAGQDLARPATVEQLLGRDVAREIARPAPLGLGLVER